MRRLLILASTMVFFDVAFYAAIAPLLPDYVATYGLSEAEAGILASAYAHRALAPPLAHPAAS
jgi:predicted MFS family arabinose efflux permease